MDILFSSFQDQTDKEYRILLENTVEYLKDNVPIEYDISYEYTGEKRISSEEYLYEITSLTKYKDSGIRYSGSDTIHMNHLLRGGPFHSKLISYFQNKSNIQNIQSILSGLLRRGKHTLVPRILNNQSLLLHTGRILLPSAFSKLLNDTSSSILEIHPDNGELLMLAAVTGINYTGYEPDETLLPEMYEEQDPTFDPRPDLRGVLDSLRFKEDTNPKILVNSPSDLNSEYDIVIIRQPRSQKDIRFAMSLVSYSGKLIVIPGEHSFSKGGDTQFFLSNDDFPIPNLVGIQTTDSQFIGALVYSNVKPGVSLTPLVDIPKSKSVMIKGVPYINSYHQSLVLLASAIKEANLKPDVNIHRMILQYSNREMMPLISSIAEIPVSFVNTKDEEIMATTWFRSLGESVITLENLSSPVREILVSMIFSKTQGSLKPRKKANKIAIYGNCGFMISAIGKAYPRSVLSLVIPHTSSMDYTTISTISTRGADKFRILRNVDPLPVKSIIDSISAKIRPDIIWNAE
jgi:hypothetical protein